MSKASIRPSGHIDNGQGHSDRVLKNGKRKRTNYDSTHWDVGAAARDLLRVGVTATSSLGPQGQTGAACAPCSKFKPSSSLATDLRTARFF